eukprot:COSAG01_NODE_29719_length_631_cov_1.152256_1_plen_115_part_00
MVKEGGRPLVLHFRKQPAADLDTALSVMFSDKGPIGLRFAPATKGASGAYGLMIDAINRNTPAAAHPLLCDGMMVMHIQDAQSGGTTQDVGNLTFRWVSDALFLFVSHASLPLS